MTAIHQERALARLLIKTIIPTALAKTFNKEANRIF